MWGRRGVYGALAGRLIAQRRKDIRKAVCRRFDRHVGSGLAIETRVVLFRHDTLRRGGVDATHSL